MKKLTLLLMIILFALPYVNGQVSAFEKESKFDFKKTVEAIKEKATEAGWSIPTEHDMQASMKKKNKEISPSTILVLCNSNYAYKLLRNDETREAQSMLPCRIAIYEKSNGKTYLAWPDYAKAGKGFSDEAASVFSDAANEIKGITSTIIKE